MAREHVVRGYEEVVGALGDPHLVPVPAEGGAPYGAEWLRGSAARFSAADDPAHLRRRAMAERDLARVEPSALRSAAAAGARAGEGDDRLAVVGVLAQALGLKEPAAIAAAVTTVAAAYFGGAGARAAAAADDAVAWLVPRMDAADDESAANRVALLVQACDATAALAERSRRAAAHAAPGVTVDELLARTLRDDPPVTALRRLAVRDTRVGELAVAAGDLVLLDVAAANRDPAGRPPLTFGVEPRRCPGAAHALALAAGLLSRPEEEDVPATDGRDPARVVADMVAHVLDAARTWTSWDGEPVPSGDRLYTPHKAVRRVADHLLDHLAELEARLAGEEPEPDHWHASATTTPADLAPFTAEDLDEARSRLTRLARMWSQRLGAFSGEQLDRSPGPGWSFRQLAFHLEGSAYYADSVGRLPGGAA
ncbi:Cytochrome P450 [Actinacidiphila rubida]|uniref:Cytochrome P450 n=1 Tax=Actinacidiphila rubida TaxID=310780 RepID=A0A1H8TNP4_9ACTN|nr:hypothetical protein [Actinacidiphila rubida]SEO92456.1 Cytochrome P450 [Actinacidiphila rubida]